MKSQDTKIVGTNVDLSKVTYSDLRLLADWRNAKGIWEYNNQFVLLNMRKQKEWFGQINVNNSDRIMFMIHDKKNKTIGVCGLTHINRTDRNAQVAIILGEQKLHGRGLGSETLRLLVNYGFNRLKLHRISAEIFSYNIISMGLFKKLGFEHEVTLRDALWRNGRWYDIHLLSLLSNEITNNQH